MNWDIYFCIWGIEQIRIYGTNKKNATYYRSVDSLMEYQANEFAAALLMPKKEYKKIMNQYTTGNKVETDKVADYFGVSVSVASSRGKFLGYLQ